MSRGAHRASPQRREVGAVLLVTLLLGLAYLALVPRGLPYDEPAHWQNVVYVATHHRMPEIGTPGTSYEAQMGPLAYVVMAVAAAPFRLVGEVPAFYAARFVGLAELLVLVVLLMRLVRRALPAYPRAGLLAGCVAGLNPMLLAMSASVQNDTLALVVGVAALDLATRGHPSTVRRSVVLGLLAGLALLTKITVWPILLVVGLLMLRRRAWWPTVVYGVTALLVSGWWFVRNVVLYGDLTGQAGVEAAGYTFPAGTVSPAGIAQSVVTYLWIPTEYVRNTVVSPSWVDGLVVLMTVAGLVGALAAFRHPTPVARTLAVVAGIAVAGWLVVTTTQQGVAFRFAYAALPAWFVGVGALAGGRRWIPAALVLALVVVNVWFLVSVAGEPAQPLTG